MSKNSISGLMEWHRLPNMAGGHWYPSIIELPPKVSGSNGTCALVLGGQKSVTPWAQADTADLACPKMGVVFGGSAYALPPCPACCPSTHPHPSHSPAHLNLAACCSHLQRESAHIFCSNVCRAMLRLCCFLG
jgi:hypothetical protein